MLLAALAFSLAIVGGSNAESCEFPSTASFGHCSGVLVHPNIVLTAGHCFPDAATDVQISFGSSRDNVVFSTKAEYCQPALNYTFDINGRDYAYCWIEEPVTAIPATPIINELDLEEIRRTEGSVAYAVGFGRDAHVDGQSGVKKEAKLDIGRIREGEVYLLDRGEGVPCYGDSGGPVYTQLEDGGWRVLGVNSGGGLECTRFEVATLATQAIDLVMDDMGIALTGITYAPKGLASKQLEEGCAPIEQTVRLTEDFLAEDELMASNSGCSASTKNSDLCSLFAGLFVFCLLHFRRARS